MKLTRTLAIPALALAVIAGGLSIGATLPGVEPPTPAPAAACLEDEPCWNCETMGNHICGTLTPPDIEDAWDLWQKMGGAAQLLVNPHATATLTGYTFTDPYARGAGMLTAQQLALHRGDVWYIFTTQSI